MQQGFACSVNGFPFEINLNNINDRIMFCIIAGTWVNIILRTWYDSCPDRIIVNVIYFLLNKFLTVNMFSMILIRPYMICLFLYLPWYSKTSFIQSLRLSILSLTTSKNFLLVWFLKSRIRSLKSRVSLWAKRCMWFDIIMYANNSKPLCCWQYFKLSIVRSR